MKSIPRLFLLLVVVVCIVMCAFGTSFAGGDEWRPIDPAELSSKASTVEKDADAEALFWEVKVADDEEGLIFTHYIRIKILTDRGMEAQSKVQIPFGKFFGEEIKIKDITARTVKPDGTIIELKKEDIFESVQVKVSGAKVKVKSFAVPGIEAGAIIDYRWREVRPNRSANYLRLNFQRDIPVRLVKYLIKPYPFPGYGMRSQTFHGANTPFVKEKDGFFSTTMTNIPALKEEPRMPPEDQIRTWMLIYYTRGDTLIPEKFWQGWGKAIYEMHKTDTKISDEVRSASTEAVGDASTPNQKLERLYNFVRNKVKNINDDASGLTPEERAKLKENKSPSDTLKRGKGSSEDIDMLFAALALAAGLDAHVVELPDRSDIFFDESFPNGYFLRLHCVAVQVEGRWSFYDPASAYCPFGMLPWWKEGEKVLILDAREPIWTMTPLSPPDSTRVTRVARLKLADDGTLEGEVRIEFTGQFAIEKKEENDAVSPAQREETLKGNVQTQMSTAEISNIEIDNVKDATKPFVYSYHVRVAGYAQRTGKRLFLQPAVFQHGIGPLFSTSERKYAVYFHYPWSENDEVDIELPAGYALDSPDAPAPIGAGAISVYKPTLGASADGKLMVYKRSFFFGGGGTILFPPNSYGQLKTYFDAVHTQDNHTVTLKQTAAVQ